MEIRLLSWLWWTYIGPDLQGGRVDLVELVEVAVDDGVFREAVLRAGRHGDGTRHLLSCGRLVVDLSSTFNTRVRHLSLPEIYISHNVGTCSNASIIVVVIRAG